MTSSSKVTVSGLLDIIGESSGGFRPNLWLRLVNETNVCSVLFMREIKKCILAREERWGDTNWFVKVAFVTPLSGVGKWQVCAKSAQGMSGLRAVSTYSLISTMADLTEQNRVGVQTALDWTASFPSNEALVNWIYVSGWRNGSQWFSCPAS